jgi:hypothetical protein
LPHDSLLNININININFVAWTRISPRIALITIKPVASIDLEGHHRRRFSSTISLPL